MKKSDFTKGQTVWLKYVGNRRGEVEISERTVKSIGSKYITVSLNRYKDVKFEIENNFIEHTDYRIQYSLYLSREDIEKENELRERRDYVRRVFRSEQLEFKLSEEDLNIICEIAKKYVKQITILYIKS